MYRLSIKRCSVRGAVRVRVAAVGHSQSRAGPAGHRPSRTRVRQPRMRPAGGAGDLIQYMAKRRHQQHTRGLSPRHTRNIGHLTYCNGSAGQNWQINGECLDITGAGTANGTELQDSA